MPFFRDTAGDFRLTGDPVPTWRAPQLGALGSLLAHFSLRDREHPIVSIPTGAGKTALALAAAYLLPTPPRRVLIVEPSVALREQVLDEARTLRTLRRISCIPIDAPEPTVQEMTGLTSDWSTFADADIVVALPNSISPEHYDAGLLPPIDLFDLVIVDEAHHVVATTWLAIVSHFVNAQTVLLTATPFRRDGKRLPGKVIYHYPVSTALADGIYQPVEPHLVTVTEGEARASVDARIAARVVELLNEPRHQSSALLIRANTVARLKELAELYGARGIPVECLHNGLGDTTKEAIVKRLRAGESRAVAVVDMLGEGFDLPRLRIAAYHDKHR